MSSSGKELSDLPSDFLSEIINRLEVVEFVRSGAVCGTWRNLPGRKYSNKPQNPWLMLSSRDKVEYRYFYSITEKKKYDVYLPDIGGWHCIGSSQGFLICVDNNANLHVSNPMTGSRILLPPTSASSCFTGVVTDSDTGQITHYIEKYPPSMQLGVDFFPVRVSTIRDYHYKKVILSPSKDIAVTIYGAMEKLAFARVGDDRWTALDVPVYDAAFHKGRLHVINNIGNMTTFDDLDSGKPTLVLLSPLLLYPPLYDVDYKARASCNWYLVESPDGEDLFLVYRGMEDGEEGYPRTIGIEVFLLDKATYAWNLVKTLGDVSLFLGFHHSMSLCTRNFPGLKRNSVYFTEDHYKFLTHLELAGDMRVFPIYVYNDLDQLDWPSPIWFMPTLS